MTKKAANIRIIQGDWARLGQQAEQLRRTVFIDEQNVSQEEEWDGLDPDCLHFLAYSDERPIGTARLLPDGHIGRVAVLSEQRGNGIGRALMMAAIEAARHQQLKQVELAAQTHALTFYERLGFQAKGSVFLDAGIPHRHMTLSLIR
ncbi:GNAT family N-acetyltransferase [Halomonas halocynthiae]|uniref:GNAT family N-acetyltransferase n=1 Tax=Halomonas halocynthiae TaxID=176290 RepID=UPI000406A0ED|nr:GNAT family N-acetyltransferase [Halomonas halocynthiae]